MWVVTLFWIYSKNRSQSVSKVKPRLEIDRLGVVGPLSNQTCMPIWWSIGWSKSSSKTGYFQILTVLCYFWLAMAKYDFWKPNFFKVNFCLIKKVIYETLVNLIVLNKFFLCYMGLRPIFREIVSEQPIDHSYLLRFPRINLVWFKNHSRTWGGHRIADIHAPRDILVKMSKIDTYHNEKLFGSIELWWVIIIRIEFSHDLTNIELFPQNHSTDFERFSKNAQNPILNIKNFYFFRENDIGLKSAQRYGLSIPNNGFFIWHL